MSKVVHCKREPYDVYIGRPSKFGNPFTHIADRNTLAQFVVATREESIAAYEKWIRSQPELMAAAKKELKGKILGCWCAPLSCHGDVLLKIANEEEIKIEGTCQDQNQ
jgi:hypothetical protein